MKKLALLLTVLLALGTLCALAEEAEPTVYRSGDWEYVLLEDGTAEVTGYTGSQKELTIPDQLDGYAVTAIGYEAFSDDALTSVVIPDSITKVGGAPFSAPFSDPADPYRYWDSALTSIHLGAGVTDLLWSSNTQNGFDSLIYPALAHITVSPENPVYCVENGLLIDKTTATLICCPPAMTGDIIIPDWVTGGVMNAINGASGRVYLSSSMLRVGYAGVEYVPQSALYMYPDALTDGRMQELLEKTSSNKERRIISDLYKKIDPANYRKSEDPATMEAAYPALKDGTVIWVLRKAKEDEKNKSALQKTVNTFANIGYTAEDLAADYRLVFKAEMPVEEESYKELCWTHSLHFENIDRLPRGCAVSNLPGGLAIAWAVQRDLIPVDLVRSGSFFYTLNKDGTARLAAYVGEDSAVVIPGELDGHVITSVGGEAFIFAANVTSITLPDSVTELADTAFACCPGLTDIYLSPEHPTMAVIDGVLFEMSTKTLLYYPEGRTAQCYEVPRGIRRIAPYAFATRGMLNRVYDSSFVYADTDGVQQVFLPDTVMEVGEHAFDGNSSLTSANIPKGVMSIGDYAFRGCSSLTSITLPDNVTTIGDYAFCGCSSLMSVTIPDLVTSIGSFAFLYCSSLTSVTIPDSVTGIGSGAFNHCTSLTGVALPDSVTAIADSAFYGCASLMSITLPDGLTTIGEYAFFLCTALTSITLPDSVTAIGDFAFSSCSSLTSITLPVGVTTIGDWAFSDCGRITFTVPRNSWAAQYCKDNNLPYTYTDSLDWLLN